MDREKAMEIVKKLYNDSLFLKEDKEAMSTLIPELVESEDEKIRKEMIRYFTEMKKGGSAALSYDDCIAYLEKQRNLDEMIVVSPEVWDKAISDAFENGRKEGEKQKEQKSNILQNAFDKSKKDYTLEEKSKASDYAESILPTSIMYGESEEEYKLHTIIEAAFIAGQKEQKPIGTDFRTAVKNLMNLHKIKNEFTEEDYDFHAKELLELVKQKPEWSEEDEKNLKSVVGTLWFALNTPHFPLNYERIIELEGWLKSLRPQPRQEWSEEDEKMLTGIIERGSSQIPSHEPALREDQMEWLMKRLRFLRPSWKPSEEQMETLRWCKPLFYDPKLKKTLESLIDDLEKLM